MSKIKIPQGLLWVLFLVCSHSLYAVTNKTITLHFNEKDFAYSFNEDSSLTVSTEKFLYDYETDAMALPYIYIKVLIDGNQSLSKFTYDFDDEIKLFKTEVNNAPKIMQVGSILTNGETLYNDSTKRIIENVSCTGNQIAEGYKLLLFRVFPFKYDYETSDLSLLRHLSISIELNDSLKSHTSSGILPSSDLRLSVKNMVINGDEVDSMYGKSVINDDYMLEATEDGLDYVIITNSTLALAFQKLSEWKRTRGVRTKVFIVDSIYVRFPNELTSQLKIKRFIQSCKNNYNIKYVLLGGDDSVVPVQYCHGEAFMQGETVQHNLPTDLFYACLDEGGYDFAWDSNNNRKCGEINDNIDYMADVSLTRAPVRSLVDANAFVDKIISYESCPPIDDWHHKILMCGNQFGDSIMNPSDSQRKGEKLYQDAIAGNWDGSLFNFYDTYTDFDGWENYAFSGINLQTQLSRGYNFVDVITHGNIEHYKMETINDDYDFVYALDLENPFPTIITTTACMTNAFNGYFDPCLSEAFIRNRYSGIIAYIGSSDDGLDYANVSSLGPSPELNMLFYKKMFTYHDYYNYLRFGNIVKETKNEYASHVNNPSFRWVYFSVNPIGDPEMPVFRCVPKVFNNVELSVVNDTVFLETNIDACKLHITSMSDYGMSYYRGYDIRFGETQAIYQQGLPDSVYICVIKPDYVPLLYKYYKGRGLFMESQNDTYIQNWSFASPHLFTARKIFVGSNVTGKQANGPVKVYSGKLVLKGKEGVTIKNDFEVKTGAELIITGKD